MRALLITLLIAAGCASAVPATRGNTWNESDCEDLGRVVFNPRNPVLNPTQTMGPSDVYWYRSRPASYLTLHDGHAYRCTKPT